MQKVVPVVMAGGSGTRLWPLSRKLFPKQFLPLMGEQTMLQDTLSRLGSDAANPIVVCNDEHRFNVAEQLRQQGQKAANIILEPIGRNTAPAVALSSYAALSEGADPILLVLAADHVIRDEKAFQSAVQLATASA
ncbi:sugar phosphate nucleotidyltransferase, partial [Oleiphilus sp. HI0125]